VSTIQAYVILVVAVVLVVVVVFVSMTYLSRYRARRLKEIREGPAGTSFGQDRAYNRIALARREADLLEAQGGDPERARQLITLAGQSLDRREVARAYDLAQSAHETLVTARRVPLRARATPAAAEGTPPADTVLVGAVTAGKDPTPPPAPPNPVAKNRAEAQFQLRLFEEDLARATKRSPATPPDDVAKDTYVQASAAFARADYAEAFRLSLRGRRLVGGAVESLGLPARAATGAGGATVPADPARLAEEVAAAGRCAACGHPTVKGDGFCRGCGAPIGPTTCSKCGAPRLATDAFCGRCGLRYD
jgi:hypothetical protein